MKFWTQLSFLCCLLAICPLRAGADSNSATQASDMPPERQAFFHHLNSPMMEVIEEQNPFYDEPLSDYPLLARLIQLDAFKWDPEGKPSGKLTSLFPECDLTAWQAKVLGLAQTPAQYLEQLGQLVQTCSKHWTTGWSDPISNTLGTLNLQLHPRHYPYARHVLFHLPNHNVLKGLLAMKTDGKKRPLLIFRTGIFSNTQEFYPERFLFFQMFEQSSFNVLLLESLSGSEYLKHNDSFSMGGFDEGLQNFLIAQKLQNPQEPLSKYIESVHLLGMSLGGHGALFAALLNQWNPKVIQSVQTFCPVLNLQDTLSEHRKQSFQMSLMNYWASRRLKVARRKWPELRDSQFVPDFFALIQKNYQSPLLSEKEKLSATGKVADIQLPPLIEKILKDPNPQGDLFWRLNQFWPAYSNVETPVLLFSTRKDPVVPWSVNSGRVADGQMTFPSSNVKLIPFEEGYHCSFPIAYDWSTMTTLFQTTVLKFSPSHHLQTKQVRIPLTPAVSKAFPLKNAVLSVKFEIQRQTSTAFVSVRFDQPFDPSFGSSFLDWWTAPRMTTQLPLSEMEFPIEKFVRNADEVSLFQRWAYQNIQTKIEGKDLVFSWNVTAP